MNTAVYGNLALKPIDQKPVFSLVYGGKKPVVVAAPRQIAAPDVYARAQTDSQKHPSTALVLACIAVILCAVLVVSYWESAARSSLQATAISQITREEIVVQPGDSLWNIAEERSIEYVSTADTVKLIKDWNRMDTSMLQAGMRLTVPSLG